MLVGKYLLYLCKPLIKWPVFQKNTGNPVYFMYNKGKRINMSAINNRSGHYKTIRETCYTANVAYIVLRLFYLIFFAIAKVYSLVWYSAATILFYIFCFYLMKKKKYYPYALLCGNEYFGYIITTTLLVGFASGFHLYLIGLAVISFFATYFSKTKKISGSLLWAEISIGLYLMLYFVTKNNAPKYIIPDWMTTTFMTVHIVVVFLFVAFYLFTFTRYSLSLENKIMQESRTDELTQISNRYGLYDYFNKEGVTNSKSLALFDIDNFKVINDTYGHVAGDFILKRIAEIMSTVLSDCFICRYGGEEFIVVLETKGCFEKLESLRKAVENEVIEYEGHKHKVTITIGVAKFSKELSAEKWIALADEKMYQGKNSGKNKTVI